MTDTQVIVPSEPAERPRHDAVPDELLRGLLNGAVLRPAADHEPAGHPRTRAVHCRIAMEYLD
jgi:hypothetical protein